MHVKVIRSDTDLDDATHEIERLWGAEPGSDDGDKLDALVALVAAYEDKHYPIPKSDPVGVLMFSMAQNGRTQADLATLFGSRPRASEVLNGKRALTLDQIRKLSRIWRIPAEALLDDRVEA
jgi:HTH-type transcriptional regulator/antitoxin HigA